MKDTTVTGPADDPQGQAPETAARYLRAAVAAIDETFGEGYARDHPELVASFLQASAIESAVETGRGTSDRALDLIRHLSRETNETILKLKPRLFG